MLIIILLMLKVYQLQIFFIRLNLIVQRQFLMQLIFNHQSIKLIFIILKLKILDFILNLKLI